MTSTPQPLYVQKNKPRFPLNNEFVWAPEPVWTFSHREKYPGSVENRTSTPPFSEHVPSSIQQQQNGRSKHKPSPVYLRCMVNCVKKDVLRKECLNLIH